VLQCRGTFCCKPWADQNLTYTSYLPLLAALLPALWQGLRDYWTLHQGQLLELMVLLGLLCHYPQGHGPKMQEINQTK